MSGTHSNNRKSEQLQLLSQIRGQGLEQRLKDLKKPDVWRSVLAIALDWTVIFVSLFACVFVSWWLLPFALLAIASRQIALNNLLHEASHKNLARNAKANNFLGNWFCALPTLTTLPLYQATHMHHHRFLGDPENDPDFLPVQATHRGWAHRWVGLLFNSSRFFDAIFGSVTAMTLLEVFKVACWWSVWFGFLSLVFGLETGAMFAMVWFLARAVVYYPISTFREMADHYGLDSTSWLGNTRNVESNALLTWLIHPHEDGYHLVHHLIPTIPFHQTRAAHEELMKVPGYNCLHHCDSYFAGVHSLSACMNGACSCDGGQ